MVQAVVVVLLGSLFFSRAVAEECPETMEWSECASPCPKRCGKDRSFDGWDCAWYLNCLPGCSCPEDLFLEPLTNKCVEECPSYDLAPRVDCDALFPGETAWDECHDACPLECGEPQVHFCQQICLEACSCPRNHWIKRLPFETQCVSTQADCLLETSSGPTFAPTLEKDFLEEEDPVKCLPTTLNFSTLSVSDYFWEIDQNKDDIYSVDSCSLALSNNTWIAFELDDTVAVKNTSILDFSVAVFNVCDIVAIVVGTTAKKWWIYEETQGALFQIAGSQDWHRTYKNYTYNTFAAAQYQRFRIPLANYLPLSMELKVIGFINDCDGDEPQQPHKTSLLPPGESSQEDVLWANIKLTDDDSQ